MTDTSTTNSLNVPVVYKIGDKVKTKGSDVICEVIGYEYIHPIIKYIIINPEGNHTYRLPIEIEKVKEVNSIGFTYKTE